MSPSSVVTGWSLAWCANWSEKGRRHTEYGSNGNHINLRKNNWKHNNSVNTEVMLWAVTDIRTCAFALGSRGRFLLSDGDSRGPEFARDTQAGVALLLGASFSLMRNIMDILVEMIRDMWETRSKANASNLKTNKWCPPQRAHPNKIGKMWTEYKYYPGYTDGDVPLTHLVGVQHNCVQKIWTPMASLLRPDDRRVDLNWLASTHNRCIVEEAPTRVDGPVDDRCWQKIYNFHLLRGRGQWQHR